MTSLLPDKIRTYKSSSSAERALNAEVPYTLSPQRTLKPAAVESPHRTESPHSTESSVAFTARRENTMFPYRSASPQKTESPPIMLKVLDIPNLLVAGSRPTAGEP